MRKMMFLVLVINLVLFPCTFGLNALAGPPPLPSSFYGTVLVNSQTVPAGTAITAWINGVQYANSQAILYQGSSVFALDVPGDDVETPAKEGGVEGDVITFRIAGEAASQTAVWHSSQNVQLNLSIGGSTTPPNPVPALSSLAPNLAMAGGPAFQLTVNGSNFVSSSVVYWNNLVRPTTFISSTQLTVSISATDLAASRKVDIIAFSPTPGGGFSNALVFTVNASPQASNDGYNVEQDKTLTVAAPGVLSNDTDTEGDKLSALLVSQVKHGSLTLAADGSFTYTPTSGYSGADSFTYKATDGISNSSVATVNIVVIPGIPVTGQKFVYLPALSRK